MMFGTSALVHTPDRRPMPLIRQPRALDWRRRPAVVLESDDWGQCEAPLPDANAAGHSHTVLETPDELRQLYALLERYRDAAGLPAVVTPFVCVGNPDFEAMTAEGFARYVDIGIDRGTPRGLDHGADVAALWREGMRRGVFAPEYHSNLHHTGPLPLLELLRADDAQGGHARERFKNRIYSQGRHLPEYESMTPQEALRWIQTGVERFTRAVGSAPAAAVNSDAYLQIETLWALSGIRIVSMKASRVNTGAIVLFGTKPWNHQDSSVPMGAYDLVNRLVYLWRNVYFECGIPSPQATDSADEARGVIQACWDRNEPAVISMHRSFVAGGHGAKGRLELGRLLGMLCGVKGLRFLSSREAGDLYGRGWCLREFGPIRILRKWDDAATPLTLAGRGHAAIDLATGRRYAFQFDGSQVTTELPCGDYRLE